MEKETTKKTDSVSAVTKQSEIKIREYVVQMFEKDVEELPQSFKELTGMLQSYCAWRSLYRDLLK